MAAPCAGGPDQRWQTKADGRIGSEVSGTCLDVSGQARADGSRVTLYTCTPGSNEVWSKHWRFPWCWGLRTGDSAAREPVTSGIPNAAQRFEQASSNPLPKP
ncbi:ricin-type beta-trefoil lectin domain protein [Streptomyces sp. NPDC048415]|uniref:ricin-type beta-trefoil lectin domain protein n=1 Tax=Streptomyces sp. NPDC048415 TaxID=3154822 RepID=UPI00342FC30D